MITSKWLFGKDAINEVQPIRDMVEATTKDAYDDIALHVLVGEEGEWLATGRLYEKDAKMMLGPIYVAPQVAKGVDDLLARMLISKGFELFADEIYTEAKEDEVAFFEGLNFCEYDDYEKDGVKYYNMKLLKEVSPIPSGCEGCNQCGGDCTNA